MSQTTISKKRKVRAGHLMLNFLWHLQPVRVALAPCQASIKR